MTKSIPHHVQLSHTSPRGLQIAILDDARALDGVVLRQSITCRGAISFTLTEDLGALDVQAFIAQREFAHIHPPYDGSLHMMLPLDVAHICIDNGWAEQHPVHPSRPDCLEVMVYGARDLEDFEPVKTMLHASYRFAFPKNGDTV